MIEKGGVHNAPCLEKNYEENYANKWDTEN